jgi:hypothetical protein
MLAAVGCSAIGRVPATESPGYVSPGDAKTLLDQCEVIGAVQAYFSIPPGDDYHSVLPLMGKSPELEGVDGAFVAIYSGEVQALYVTGIPGVERPKITDAVCVVLPSGEPLLYNNVSRENMVLPPGAQEGPPPD